jgi:hypothetical protein
VDLLAGLCQAVDMAKNRKMTYAEHQAEADRAKKQAELLKKQAKPQQKSN